MPFGCLKKVIQNKNKQKYWNCNQEVNFISCRIMCFFLGCSCWRTWGERSTTSFWTFNTPHAPWPKCSLLHQWAPKACQNMSMGQHCKNWSTHLVGWTLFSFLPIYGLLFRELPLMGLFLGFCIHSRYSANVSHRNQQMKVKMAQTQSGWLF